MRKKTTIGDGITARELEELDAAGIRQYLGKLSERSAGKNAFDAKITRAEQWALAVLKKAGIEPGAEENGTADKPENYAQRIVTHIHFIRGFIEGGDAARAANFALILGAIVTEARIKFQWEALALYGDVMSRGRKPGTSGPIRKAVTVLLEKKPLKNDELWKALSTRPPRGWQFYDNHLGKYIEGPKGGDGMAYRRFCNIAWEVRNILKG